MVLLKRPLEESSIVYTQVKEELKSSFVNILSSLFKCVYQEINDVIIATGYNPEDYIITSYPCSITRKNGKRVPKKLVNAIIKNLKMTL